MCICIRGGLSVIYIYNIQQLDNCIF